MNIKFALAGNPNCGKTTMFNALTGANQYVGNWPGVTVEKKEGKVKGNKEDNITVVDLPGIYSLSPYTLEEVVSRDFLLNEDPDVIIDLVDATNIERNLYLTTQLIETGVPVVVALNMADLIEKRGLKIDTKRLSMVLGCPIIETSALKGTGLKELIAEAVKVAKQSEHQLPGAIFCEKLEKAMPHHPLRVALDLRNEKITYKIREHSMQKLPFILVAGEKERAAGAVAVRSRGNKDLGVMPIDTFIELIAQNIAAKA